jgi:hypothetical protein
VSSSHDYAVYGAGVCQVTEGACCDARSSQTRVLGRGTDYAVAMATGLSFAHTRGLVRVARGVIAELCLRMLREPCNVAKECTACKQTSGSCRGPTLAHKNGRVEHLCQDLVFCTYMDDSFRSRQGWDVCAACTRRLLSGQVSTAGIWHCTPSVT